MTQRIANGYIVTMLSEGDGIRLPPESRCRGHVAIVYDGCLEENIDGVRRRYRPSHVEFWPAGRHTGEIRREPGSIGLIMEFEPWRLASFIPMFPQPFDPGYVPRSNFGMALTRAADEFFRVDDVSPFALEAALLDIVVHAARAVAHELPPQPHWLEAAVEIIDRSFREPISLADVARTVCVHPTRLAEAFRKAKHTSVGEYIRRRRVDLAAVLLTESDVTISAIALDTGFYDQAHMTRAFRALKGTTPLEFRRSRAGAAERRSPGTERLRSRRVPA